MESCPFDATLQAKLLTVLQNRTITRLGTNKTIPVDVRLICATNMPLAKMVAEGTFRQDLLYRINTVELTLPPLRDRGDDIPLLVEHFVKVYANKYGKAPKSPNKSALDKLRAYAWPGNIRELQHAVERALILGENSSLCPDDFLLSPPEP